MVLTAVSALLWLISATVTAKPRVIPPLFDGPKRRGAAVHMTTSPRCSPLRWLSSDGRYHL